MLMGLDAAAHRAGTYNICLYQKVKYYILGYPSKSHIYCFYHPPSSRPYPQLSNSFSSPPDERSEASYLNYYHSTLDDEPLPT